MDYGLHLISKHLKQGLFARIIERARFLDELDGIRSTLIERIVEASPELSYDGRR